MSFQLMIMIVCKSFGKCVDDVPIEIGFYWCQEIVVNKYLERNFLIRHKHGKQIYVTERFVVNVLWKVIPYNYLRGTH
jgi:hypothetical protein